MISSLFLFRIQFLDVGSAFYEPELSLVPGSLSTTFSLSRENFKEENQKNKKDPIKEAFVKWLGYDDNYSSWEPLSAIGDIKL